MNTKQWGICWICGNEGNSYEHQLKKSDVDQYHPELSKKRSQGSPFYMSPIEGDKDPEKILYLVWIYKIGILEITIYYHSQKQPKSNSLGWQPMSRRNIIMLDHVE